MLAGAAGTATATLGNTGAATAIVAAIGEGAWHDPPQPQSKPRASLGARMAGACEAAAVRSDE